MSSYSIMLVIALLFLAQSLVCCVDKRAWSGSRLPLVPERRLGSRLALRHRIVSNFYPLQPSSSSSSLRILLEASRGGGQDRYYDSHEGGRYDYDNEPKERDYNGDGDDYYYEQDNSRHKPQSQRYYNSREEGTSTLSSTFSGKLPSQRKLGSGCLAAGSVLMLLGVSLFFNKTLLRLGNMLLLIGVPLMFGPSKTMGYFLQPAKARATACLGVGIILVVLLGRPILGIVMQVFGLLNLFGNMFPMIRLFLSQMPVVGDLFKPGNSKKSHNTEPSRQHYDSRTRDDSGYYETDNYEESYY